MRRALVVFVVVLCVGGSALAASLRPEPPQVYQKMASEGVTVTTPTFVLVQGVDTLYVRFIRIQLVGIESSDGWLAGRFACWFAGDPIIVIDSIQFNAGPDPNGETQVESFDWPPDYYRQGLPAPTVGDSILCGWEAPSLTGQTLIAGFARVRMLFKDN